MRKVIIFGLVVWLVATISLAAKVHSDGTNPDDWSVYAGEGTVESIDGSIVLSGDGLQTGYQLSLDDYYGESGVTWDLKYDQDFSAYFQVMTDEGVRYLQYTSFDSGAGEMADGVYIHIPLGSEGRGKWNFFSRDLEKDLQMYQPNNRLTNGSYKFMVRGDVSVRYVEKFPNTSIGIQGMNSADWMVYDGEGSIERLSGEEILLSGSALETGYRVLLHDVEEGANTFNWDIKSGQEFSLYVQVTTSEGVRYLQYTNYGTSSGSNADGTYMHFPLGATNSGEWHSFSRNLLRDLQTYQPNNQLLSINKVYLRGNLSIKNIYMEKSNDSYHGTSPLDWSVYDGEGTIEREGENIVLSGGQELVTGYHLPLRGVNNDANTVRFEVLADQMFSAYVQVTTTDGVRYLQYTNLDVGGGMSADGSYIHFPLGSEENSGWRTVTCDLIGDLQSYQLDNQVISIDNFYIRGNVSIKQIETLKMNHSLFYNGTDAGVWQVFMNTSGNAKVSSVIDDSTNDDVYQFYGESRVDAFNLIEGFSLNNHNLISWDVRYPNEVGQAIFAVEFDVESPSGTKSTNTIFYDIDSDRNSTRGSMEVGLGLDAGDKSWHSISRNVAEDYAFFYPNNKFLGIKNIEVRGEITTHVDNIRVFSEDE